MILGADEREYGPVTAMQLREWIAQNRANASTRVQAEGGEWKPLAAYPEFADALANRPAPVSSSAPSVADGAADQIEEEIRMRGYFVNIGHCLGRSWDLFWRYPWLLIGVTALVLVIKTLLVLVPPGFVAGLVLWGPLLGGCQMLFLQLARGRPAGVEMMFSGFQSPFVPLMVLGIVALTLTTLGFICCIIPGVYLLVVWGLFPYLLVIDRGMDFWPALMLSLKVSNLHWWKLLLFLIVLMVVAALGLLACGVGVVVSIPWAVGAIVYAYEDIFSEH